MALLRLRLDQVVKDPELQARVQADPATVARYRELYAMGVDMVAPVVFETSPSVYLVADGFQRLEAAEKEGRDALDFDARAGTREDAILYAAGANSRHGLPMTNADKLRAVTLLLRTEGGRTWTDRRIAEHCGVSAPFVGKVRRDLGLGGEDIRTRADGRTINTRGLRRRSRGPTVNGLQGTRTLAIVTVDDTRTAPRRIAPDDHPGARADTSETVPSKPGDLGAAVDDALTELEAVEARLQVLLADRLASGADAVASDPSLASPARAARLYDVLQTLVPVFKLLAPVQEATRK